MIILSKQMQTYSKPQINICKLTLKALLRGLSIVWRERRFFYSWPCMNTEILVIKHLRQDFFAKRRFCYSWPYMNTEILYTKCWRQDLWAKRRFSYSWPYMNTKILVTKYWRQDLWAKRRFSYSWSNMNTEIIIGHEQFTAIFICKA